jgi:hypothetical protein
MAGVMNRDGNWAGGDYTMLVICGDLVDRGCNSFAMIDMIIHLNASAIAEGGRVVAVIGNHELMNLNGIYAYTTTQDLDFTNGPEGRAAALMAGSKYGDFIRRHLRAYFMWNRVLFVHGGIHADWATPGLNQMSAKLSTLLSRPKADLDAYYADPINDMKCAPTAL